MNAYSHIDKEMGELAMGKLNGFLESMGKKVECCQGRPENGIILLA